MRAIRGSLETIVLLGGEKRSPGQRWMIKAPLDAQESPVHL
jgi:hypothetical protein